MSGRKRTSREKLKVASQEERLHEWREFARKPSCNHQETYEKVIDAQLDIKLGQSREEFDIGLKK